MIAEERRARIVELVNRNGSMSLADLTAALASSESTVRRDLVVLNQLGRIRRVHGGATKVASAEYVMTDQALGGRKEERIEEKRAIGSYAASLVSATDFVFIDGGSTTECLVDAITDTSALYMTNSLPLAQKLLAKGCHTLLPGGEIKQSTEVLVGAETVNHIRRYHFTIGFFGTNAAGLETGFTTPEVSEAAVKQIALEHTERPFVLCDSRKFSKVSLISFAEFSAATVITDHLDDPSYRIAGNVMEVG